ncbi:MAG: zf-HC2 domain-containing protein [Firmicutes bacterium]|nr:zf-HC2 domain-containing protein [Bacillota bacterium]
MDCNKASMLIMKYLDKDITEKEQNKLTKHLEVCSECREEFNLLNDTFEIVEDLEDVEPPKDIEKKVMASIDKGKYKKKSYKNLIYLIVSAFSVLSLSTYFIFRKLTLSIPGLISDFSNFFIESIVKFVSFIVVNTINTSDLLVGLVKLISKFTLILPIVLLVFLFNLVILELCIVKIYNINIRRN